MSDDDDIGEDGDDWICPRCGAETDRFEVLAYPDSNTVYGYGCPHCVTK